MAKTPRIPHAIILGFDPFEGATRCHELSPKMAEAMRGPLNLYIAMCMETMRGAAQSLFVRNVEVSVAHHENFPCTLSAYVCLTGTLRVREDSRRMPWRIQETIDLLHWNIDAIARSTFPTFPDIDD